MTIKPVTDEPVTHEPVTDEAIEAEIVALHIEFDRWFDGSSPSLDRVDRSLAPDFLFVAPSGAVLPRDGVLAGLDEARGTGSRHIRIENVAVRWRRGGLLAATYEEWQSILPWSSTQPWSSTGPSTGAPPTTPGAASGGEVTARLSTVVMAAEPDAPAGLRWLAVHETWLQG